MKSSGNRRHFLRAVAGTAAGAGWGRVLEGKLDSKVPTQRARSGRPLDVSLFLDVEDIFSPPEVGNDDSIQELATILTEEGLRANFLFTGDRAELLKERGRLDVIESLQSHEVGLHTRSAATRRRRSTRQGRAGTRQWPWP